MLAGHLYCQVMTRMQSVLDQKRWVAECGRSHNKESCFQDHSLLRFFVCSVSLYNRTMHDQLWMEVATGSAFLATVKRPKTVYWDAVAIEAQWPSVEASRGTTSILIVLTCQRVQRHCTVEVFMGTRPISRSSDRCGVSVSARWYECKVGD